MTHFPLLTILVFLPLAGALVLYLAKETGARVIALAVTVADLVIAIPLWWWFDASSSQMQFVEAAVWISSPKIQYKLGLDGISLPLVLMTTALMPLCVLISWRSIENGARNFMATCAGICPCRTCS